MGADERNKLDRFLAEEAVDPAKPILAVGEKVGSWRICAYLGGGGFGEVYRVEHVKIGISCAMKLLRRKSHSSRERFSREAKVLAEHPHSAMPLFYEIGEEHGRPYIVMELLIPRELPKSDYGVALLLRQLCAVISSLHARGFVHRDVKPSNVLYRKSGEAVLVDYGLIKKSVSSDGCATDLLTKENVAVGTERYAAPEQLAGGAVDVSADIHALGVLVDTCFHGAASRRWNRIIRRATSSIPKQRYKSAKDFCTAVRWRFLPEIAEGMALVILVGVCAMMFAGLPQDRTRRKGGIVVTNDLPVVHSASASDAAAEWLFP